MDEPLSNLDALLRLNFRSELKKLVQEIKTTTIYVTHDQVEALSLGDRIAVMRDGRDRAVRHADGGLQQPGDRVRRRLHRQPADELPAQARLIARERAGARGRRRAHADGAARASPARRDGNVRVGIRAEDIRADLQASPDALPARAEVVEPVGREPPGHRGRRRSARQGADAHRLPGADGRRRSGCSRSGTNCAGSTRRRRRRSRAEMQHIGWRGAVSASARTDQQQLAARAAEILRENDLGGWTKAAPRLYPHQWSWDSAFIAIGLAHLDTRRAAQELRTLFARAVDDGHGAAHRLQPGGGRLLPRPARWGTDVSPTYPARRA